MILERATTALVIIDVQKAFDEIAASGARRNNPDAERIIALLLDACRRDGWAVIHVRHASAEPNSRFRPDQPSYQPRGELAERSNEDVIIKNVNSAFIDTRLESLLRSRGLKTLLITGATTNHCVETTTRMAGNLGFEPKLVRDATWTFERTGPEGDHRTAEEIHAMTLLNLTDEFAEIVTTQEVLHRMADAMTERF